MWKNQNMDHQRAVNVSYNKQMCWRFKKKMQKNPRRPRFLTWDGVLSVGWGHSDSGGVANALHRAQAYVVTEAQHVPAHDFGELLDCVNLMLRHLRQREATRHLKQQQKPNLLLLLLRLWSKATDTWDRRKSCNSCSWCDRVMTRPSLCTTRICSTPMFSCSWMDLNTHRKHHTSCEINHPVNESTVFTHLQICS